MHRSVDAPDQVWNDLHQAAAWLGLTDGEFRAEALRVPDRLPHARIGRKSRWHWTVLVAYDWWRNRTPDHHSELEKK